MRIEILQLTLNLQSFYDFAKLNREQKEMLLKEEGILLDLESDTKTFTRLYYLDSFFVEEVVNRNSNEIIDIIPYKQGYKLSSFIGSTSLKLKKKSINFNPCLN